MSKSPVEKAELRPIAESDIADVAVFLREHMNGRFSTEDWQRGLRASWYEKAPNYGFMLRTEKEVVGVICALYSEQEIDGETTLICNPHSWCVLEPYRARSVSLVLSVIRQEGMHFSMYSPNKDGEEIFAYLGFQPLERATNIVANIPTPWFSHSLTASSSVDSALDKLTARDSRCVTDHRGFNWLNFIFFECDGKCGFLIFKRAKFKRMPSADMLYISDRILFEICWKAIRTELLLKHGLFTTKVEQRLLAGRLPFSFMTAPASVKFYLSQSLPPEAFDYTYSELVALDL